VTVEIIFLALASTVRPTSLAAVYALLSTDEPRRLMIVYIVAGLAFTIAFGLLVIWVFSGIDVNAGSDRTKAIAEIAGGLVAIGFGVAVVTGRVARGRNADAPAVGGRWDRLLQHRMTVRTAIVAGPVSHVPGLFYLVALNTIVSHQARVGRGLFEILLYNAIWFALPIGALAVCIVRPAAARDAVGAIERWAMSHTHLIMEIAAFLVGGVLLIRGLIEL
jgi:hypothetical protein